MRHRTLIFFAMLAAMLWSRDLHANLVADGGFDAATDIPGTSPSSPWASNSGTVIDNTFPHSPPQDAAMGDAFDASGTDTGAGTLSQQLATITGQDYILDFWVFDDQANPADTFTAQLGSFILLPVITGDAVPSYTEFTATVPSSDVGNNATLSFSATNPAGDWHLDDVSVDPVSVPEPSSVSVLCSALIVITGLVTIRRRRRITTSF